MCSFRTELLKQLPDLRGYARGLTRGDYATADDVVQETCLRAWMYQHRFTPGTNMKGWLCTIAYHFYINQYRKYGKEVASGGSELEFMGPIMPASQETALVLKEARAFLDNQVPPQSREAFSLIAFAGLSYDEAADALEIPVGTIKSRVSRVRARLVEAFQ